MEKIDLNDYICVMPFFNLEIHSKDRYLCCASWLPKSLPHDSSAKEAWESKEANEIRNSIIDGSFKYCDKTQCPHLQELNKSGIGGVRNKNTIFKKNSIPNIWKQKIDEFKKGNKIQPNNIQFSFDRSCNLKCPSCRIDIITADGKKIKEVKQTIDEIQKEYGNIIENLYITGSGDPFVSIGFKDFLKNFDKTKWSNLKAIHLHTNATRWNKKMWNSMKNIHPYVKSCEISIDAATKETYENKVRIGGNWDELMENLKFISSIKTLKSIRTSFVVQKHNYKEMSDFYDLMFSIFGERVNVFYCKINNWGTFTDEEFMEHKIWDKSNPLYDDFIKEVNSFNLKNKMWHNLQEFIESKKTII